MDDKKGHISETLRNAMTLAGLCIVITAIARTIFAYEYTTTNDWISHSHQIWRIAINSLRFDMQTAAYASLPILLIGISTLWSSSRQESNSKITSYYSATITTILSLTCLADISFYSNFGSHFNHMTFQLSEEEPSILLKGIYEENPIIAILLTSLTFGIVSYHLIRTVSKRRITSPAQQWTWTAISIVLLAFSIRGSIGTFPLRTEDIYSSSSSKLNECVPNATYMLKKAWSEKKKQFFQEETESEILNSTGFRDIHQAISTWFDVTEEQAQDKELEDWLYQYTTDTPAKEKYNIVVIVAESWSEKLIEYDHDKGWNLLMEMRHHIEEDLHFNNFVSFSDNTICAIENIVISSPYQHLFTTKYRDIHYPTSSAKLFKDYGYTTTFITGIETSWRNLDEVLPRQGFDRVIGKYGILDMNPLAECNDTWGVYDHSTLQCINDILEREQQSPHFILCLTSTSHTPFEFPKGYPFASLPDLGDNFNTDYETTMNYLKGFQYISNELGQFMNRIKNSKAGETTIIAITGDHNIRNILKKNGDEYDKRVPLYLYIPKYTVHPTITERCGSHNDIVPTIANLTLPRAKYFGTGQNLLADTMTYSIGTNIYGTISTLDNTQATKKAQAQSAIKKIYFNRLFRDSL